MDRISSGVMRLPKEAARKLVSSLAGQPQLVWQGASAFAPQAEALQVAFVLTPWIQGAYRSAVKTRQARNLESRRNQPLIEVFDLTNMSRVQSPCVGPAELICFSKLFAWRVSARVSIGNSLLNQATQACDAEMGYMQFTGLSGMSNMAKQATH